MTRITRLNELERKGKVVKGRWELDSRHRLNYTADGSREKFELETSLVAAGEDALVFTVAGEQENGRRVTSLARLSGKWRVNDQNQIEFEVWRESGKKDVLAFRGEWKVGKNHEIIYSWRRRALKRRAVTEETLTFKGHWDIAGQNQLTYLVEGSSDNAFRFRGAFRTPGILPKEGKIVYELGVEAELQSRSRRRVITLSGKWKLSRDLELVFEMECAGRKKRELRFGAEFSPREDLSVAAKLINREGEPLGIEFVLTRQFLEGHAQAFVRLRKTLRESTVESGITLPW